MKIFLAILKAIIALVLLIIVAGAGMMTYASIDQTDTFYIEGAEFSNFGLLSTLEQKFNQNRSDRLPEEELNVYVHRISGGHGTIFAYRWYSAGNITSIDDETFVKLTVWVKSLPTSFPVELSFNHSEEVKAAYTSGGSAWPRFACSGYIKSGTLQINKIGDSFSVRINGKFVPVGSRSYNRYCNKKELDIDFSASEKKYSELTPWLGLAGDYPYAETYR